MFLNFAKKIQFVICKYALASLKLIFKIVEKIYVK